MLGNMKYIIVDRTFAVVFPASIYHRDAFNMVRGNLSGRHVTGAGYLGADDEGKLFVYGESEGYGIEADPSDLEIIMGSLHRLGKSASMG
jgi:hypothetical protein